MRSSEVMAKKKNPEGVDCPCGRFTPFTAYVYAHARDVLDFTCECGRKFSIVMCRATLKRKLTAHRRTRGRSSLRG